MNSQNGVSCTELIEIIDACGRNAVTSLELAGGIKIDFAPISKQFYEPTVFHGSSDNDILESVDKLDHNIEDKKDAAEELRESMTELMITNPYAYEEIQLNGDIIDG